MRKELKMRFVAAVVLAALSAIPFLSGCGGQKEEGGGGAYFSGNMKGKGAPGAGDAAKTKPGGTGAGGP